jgi:F0F1-type ATP synthase delta subunit
MEENMSKVIVSSAKKLNKIEMDKITSAISEKEGKDCDISFVVRQSLIGGIVIQKDDIIFDGSVSQELKNIKEYLSR